MRRVNVIATQTSTTPTEMYDYLQLADIDDSRKPVDENVYTLEVNSMSYKQITVKKEGSTYNGQTIPILKGSFTIVEDANYSGRKLWQEFFVPNRVQQVFLKKIAEATGVTQATGESLESWAGQFATTNPPARLQVLVKKQPPYNDPNGDPENEINFFTAKPC